MITLRVLGRTLKYGIDFTITSEVTESLMVLDASTNFEIMLSEELRNEFSQSVGIAVAELRFEDPS